MIPIQNPVWIISFRINSSTGEIFTTKALDYEASRSYILVVQAEDQGLPQSRRTAVDVSINAIDVNDNAPKFFNMQPDVKELENLLACVAYNATVCVLFSLFSFFYALFPSKVGSQAQDFLSLNVLKEFYQNIWIRSCCVNYLYSYLYIRHGKSVR